MKVISFKRLFNIKSRIFFDYIITAVFKVLELIQQLHVPHEILMIV